MDWLILTPFSEKLSQLVSTEKASFSFPKFLLSSKICNYPPHNLHNKSIHLQSSDHFELCSSRRETLRVSSLRSALAGLLSHDQAPSHSQWGLTLPVHAVPGVLQQPGRHAEAHQEPRGAGVPPWLDHQQHLPVQLTHLNQSSHQLKIKSLKCCC